MLGYVHEQLLHGLKEQSPQIRPDRFGQGVVAEDGGNAILLPESFDQPVQSRFQPQLVQDRRAEIKGQVAGVRDRGIDQETDLCELRLERQAGGLLAQGSQFEADIGQRLADAIMQPGGELPAFALLGQGQLGGQRPQPILVRFDLLLGQLSLRDVRRDDQDGGGVARRRLEGLDPRFVPARLTPNGGGPGRHDHGSVADRAAHGPHLPVRVLPGKDLPHAPSDESRMFHAEVPVGRGVGEAEDAAFIHLHDRLIRALHQGAVFLFAGAAVFPRLVAHHDSSKNAGDGPKRFHLQRSPDRFPDEFGEADLAPALMLHEDRDHEDRSQPALSKIGLGLRAIFAQRLAQRAAVRQDLPQPLKPRVREVDGVDFPVPDPRVEIRIGPRGDEDQAQFAVRGVFVAVDVGPADGGAAAEPFETRSDVLVPFLGTQNVVGGEPHGLEDGVPSAQLRVGRKCVLDLPDQGQQTAVGQEAAVDIRQDHDTVPAPDAGRQKHRLAGRDPAEVALHPVEPVLIRQFLDGAIAELLAGVSQQVPCGRIALDNTSGGFGNHDRDGGPLHELAEDRFALAEGLHQRARLRRVRRGRAGVGFLCRHEAPPSLTRTVRHQHWINPSPWDPESQIGGKRPGTIGETASIGAAARIPVDAGAGRSFDWSGNHSFGGPAVSKNRSDERRRGRWRGSVGYFARPGGPFARA